MGQFYPPNGIGAFGSLLVKRRVFISYHHDGDQYFYDRFVEEFSENYDIFTDRSLATAVNSNDTAYVMRRIRETCITGSSCTIVLIGDQTHQRKYVDWEIKATLDDSKGLIGVLLPTLPEPHSAIGVALRQLAYPDRFRDNVDSGYAITVPWTSLVAGPSRLRELIEEANGKSPLLIRNTRSAKQSNG